MVADKERNIMVAGKERYIMVTSKEGSNNGSW
jgi:hypothetical protein